MTKKERLKYTAATMKNNIWESTILKNWWGKDFWLRKFFLFSGERCMDSNGLGLVGRTIMLTGVEHGKSF